jgi:hypothetical protein
MTRAGALAQLRRTNCACTNRKRPGKAFCPDCYHRLPQDMRAQLYQAIGEGYEAAYVAAVQQLGLSSVAHS